MANTKETQATAIAVLSRDVSDIKSTVTAIELKLDTVSKEFVRREEVNVLRLADKETATALQVQIADLRNIVQTEMVNNAVFKSQVKTWGSVGSILVGVVSPIVVGIVLHFIFK